MDTSLCTSTARCIGLQHVEVGFGLHAYKTNKHIFILQTRKQNKIQNNQMKTTIVRLPQSQLAYDKYMHNWKIILQQSHAQRKRKRNRGVGEEKYIYN